jgi:RNA polymerase sigma factor (sigma-70 family)
MLKVKAGDLDKMGLLFQRHQRPLYGFFFHMTRHRQASEDLMQNVFYRMLRSRHTFTGEGEFRTWMYHIARNVLKDHLKKSRHDPAAVDVDKILEGVRSDARTDEQIERKFEVRVLEDALARLSADGREVLVLSRLQQLKNEEIARVLEISVGAVKVRIHRAFQQLKGLYISTSETEKK